jgi:Transposase DDE domain
MAKQKQSAKTKQSKQPKRMRSSKKGIYKVTNWPQYNQALKQRGSLDVWIAEDVFDCWDERLKTANLGKLGHPFVYPSSFIELVLQLGMVFHQPLRQTEGFTRSILGLLKLPLVVPDYTTVCRRRAKLDVVSRHLPKDLVAAIADSTGLKFYGEGEWKVKKHGAGKHRMWRKLHIDVDMDGEIRVSLLTDNAETDANALLKMLEIEPAAVGSAFADGAYDQHKIYDALTKLGLTAPDIHIPPQKNAKIWQHGNCKAPPLPRDENLRAIRKSSKESWKQRSGYHARSLSETVMYRYKRTIGERVRARIFKSQQVETTIGCNILNRIAALGMPDGTWDGTTSISSKARSMSGFGGRM